jgi:hypothetical protein
VLRQLPPRLWRVAAFLSDLQATVPAGRGPGGPPGGKR